MGETEFNRFDAAQARSKNANDLLKPIATFAGIALFGKRSVDHATLEEHLQAAEAWLCRAHDATQDGGVSYGYSARGGWRASYPETSGYIATTFFRLADARGMDYEARALRILRWLVSIQNTDGSFANPRYGPTGIVFDTGQVLFGLVQGYERTRDASWLEAARRAAGWLTSIAGGRHRWVLNEHLATPHVYNTRTAWALLRMNQIEFDPLREVVARSNLDWAISEQGRSGFFGHCSFREGDPTYTHTIAYTARGLLESGALLGDPRYVDAAERSARATLAHLREDGHLPAAIATDGHATMSSCCLTGNCQFAIVWMRLHQMRDNAAFKEGAVKALDYVMSTQDLRTSNADVRGGIPGSHPVWGRYACLSLPNWATKFFIDAMWLRKTMTA